MTALFQAVRESLIEFEVDPHDVVSQGSDLNLRSEGLLHQTQTLANLLRLTVKNVKKPSDILLAQEKMSLYEEKLALYEQILVNFESSKEKQDWILQELKNLEKVSKENLLQEKCQIYESQQQIERMKLELADEYSKLENLKTQFIKENNGIADCNSESPSILLSNSVTNSPTSAGRRGSGGLPNWAMGPVQITPSSSSRTTTAGTGVVLGYHGHSAHTTGHNMSRPGSRPGSQPGKDC